MIRKHVAPADPAATIPDPERGVPLPAGGLPVFWNARWAALEARGDVVVTEIPEEALAVAEPEPPPPAPAKPSRAAPAAER